MNIVSELNVLLEYGKFGSFEGCIKYSDWSAFRDKIKQAVAQKFETIDKLLDILGLKKDVYEKIVDSLVYNWKDSVTKSLLHSVGEIGYKLPKAGDNIFPNIAVQTRFLIVVGSGDRSTNLFGQTNSLPGLRLISPISIERIPNKNPKKTEDGDQKDRYQTIGGMYALTTDRVNTVNLIMQYLWTYVFFNRNAHKKLIKKKPNKLPKVLYRGIRGLFNDKLGIQDILKKIWAQKENSRFVNKKQAMDAVINFIIKYGISKLVDGKLLSFTASKPVSEYFSNGRGLY